MNYTDGNNGWSIRPEGTSQHPFVQCGIATLLSVSHDVQNKTGGAVVRVLPRFVN